MALKIEFISPYSQDSNYCLICHNVRDNNGGRGRRNREGEEVEEEEPLSSSSSWRQFVTGSEEDQPEREELWAVFVLRKLLDFPERELRHLLVSSGGVMNPSKWIALCSECSGLVREAAELAQEILKLERSFRELKKGIQGKLLESEELAKKIAEEDDDKHDDCEDNEGPTFHEVIRGFALIEIHNKSRRPKTPLPNLQKKSSSKDDNANKHLVRLRGAGVDEDADSSPEEDPLYVPEEVEWRANKVKSGSRLRKRKRGRPRKNEFGSGNDKNNKEVEKKLSKRSLAKEQLHFEVEHHDGGDPLFASRSRSQCSAGSESDKDADTYHLAPMGSSSIKRKRGRPKKKRPARKLRLSDSDGEQAPEDEAVSPLDSLSDSSKLVCPPEESSADGITTIKREMTDGTTGDQGAAGGGRSVKQPTEEGALLLRPSKKRKYTLTKRALNKYSVCSICNQRYYLGRGYERHMELHKLHPDLACKICKHPNRTEERLRIHLARKHGIGQDVVKVVERAPRKPGKGPRLGFKCKICGFISLDYTSNQRHEETHKYGDNITPIEGSDKVLCKLCNFQGTTTIVRAHFIESHGAQVGMETHLCHLCDKVFASDYHLSHHLQRSHSEEARHSCPLCGKGFARKDLYSYHFAKCSNGGQNPNVCDHCGATFTRPQHLKTHVQKFHSGSAVPPPPPPVDDDEDITNVPGKKGHRLSTKCKTCGVRMVHSNALNVHVRQAHPHLFTYKCDECDAAYMKSKSLQTHKAAKHFKQKVSCPYCYREVGCAAFLKAHWIRYCRKVPPKTPEPAEPPQPSASALPIATTERG